MSGKIPFSVGIYRFPTGIYLLRTGNYRPKDLKVYEILISLKSTLKAKKVSKTKVSTLSQFRTSVHIPEYNTRVYVLTELLMTNYPLT